MGDETTRIGPGRSIGVAVAVLCAGSLWIWSLGSERRAIQAMPSAERVRLLAETRQSLDSVCGSSADPGLREYCQKQAEFIQQFPECDEACNELARAVLAQPPR